MKKVPVTVLTGFLGSGKTTLLNRVLTEQHGKRIAVIENEFGEIGIDQALVINADEEVFEMNNGCICCTVRGDLIRILGNLMKRRDKFDHILVETTGMADPGPVAQTFFVDDDMAEMFALDGIITLVDAKHVALHIEDSSECREQIAFADVLVLNKCDLVPAAELDALEQKVRSMNAMAKVLRSTNADVPIAAVLDVGGFDLDRAVAAKPSFLTPEYPFEWAGTYDLEEGAYLCSFEAGPDPSIDVVVLPIIKEALAHERGEADRAMRAWAHPTTKVSQGGTFEASDAGGFTLAIAEDGTSRFTLRVHKPGRYGIYTQHLPSEFNMSIVRGQTTDAPAVQFVAQEEFAAGHTHDSEVSSVGIHVDGAVDGDRFNAWLSKLLREKGTDIFRAKGIVNVRGVDNRFVFQGVHMLLDGREDRPWGDGPRACDLVFIGRNLDRDALNQEFRRCLA
jgi:G3E family GTPase